MVPIQHAALALNVEVPFEFAPDQHGDGQRDGTLVRRFAAKQEEIGCIAE